MNKIWLVIKREYLTRVRNKTFLLSTILLPLVMVLFISGSVFFAAKSEGKKKIAVENKQSELANFLKSDSSKMEFTFNTGVDTSNFAEKGYDVQFGARPLHRAIQKYLEDNLAEEILNVTVKQGDVLIAGLDNEKQKIKFEFRKKEQEAKV